VLASLVLDVSDDAMIVSEMVAVSALFLVVDLYWWWTLFIRRAPGDEGGASGALFEFKFLQSLSLFGAIGGFWLFGPLTDGYPERVTIWVAMVLGPIAILTVRLFTGFAGWGSRDHRSRKGAGT
jgi:hypothetical protein